MRNLETRFKLLVTTSLLLVGVLCFDTTTNMAQDTNAKEQLGSIDIDPGVFRHGTDNMPELLRLEVKSDRLACRTDWEFMQKRKDGPDTEEQLRQKKIDEMIAQGFTEEMAIRHAKRQMEFGRSSMHENPIIIAIEAYVSNLPGSNRGGGGGGGGDNIRWRKEGDGSRCSIAMNEGDFSLNLEDFHNDITLYVSQKSDGDFYFRYISSNSIINYSHKANEDVRLAVIAGTDAKVFTAKSFTDLKTNHATAMDTYFYPLLDKFGIEHPISFRVQNVRSSAFQLLKSTEEDEQTLEALLDGLNADSIKVRNDSQTELASNYFKWHVLIAELKETLDFDQNAKKRLAKVIEKSSITSSEQYVIQTGFADAPKLILNLYQDASESERSVIVRRLEKVSGETYGDDIDMWKEWVLANEE